MINPQRKETLEIFANSLEDVFHQETPIMIPNRFRALILALCAIALTSASFGQLAISVRFGPPALPVYEQPLCPGEGYLWTPGYWAYDADDYFWVPGTWVLAPEPGLFWTPGYWAWAGEGFTFYDGYWGPRVGFYGGINYGYGYFGEGYQGGRWDHDRFFYNRAVNNVNVTNIHNVYNTTIINNTTVNRVSYNGGNGGISARPRPEEEAAARERHIGPVSTQVEHLQAARSNPEQRASSNRGKPPVAATGRPGDFRGGGMVAAREAGAPYNPQRNEREGQPQPNGRPENNARPDNRESRSPIIHAADLPHGNRPEPPNTGNAKADQKYQQQQEKLQARQEQDQQKLQRRQEQDHQRLAQRSADESRKQQVEQRHQQQTQQLQQRHEQQQQRMQQRMPPQQREGRSNGPGGERH
jgi:WXXGXW repeat (2 copies)